MADFHLTLNPGIINAANQTIVMAFTSPQSARNVRITLSEADHWTVGGTQVSEGGRRNRDDRIARFTGSIVDGKFQGKISRNSAPRRGQPHIKVRVDGATQVHDLHVPSSRNERENGVLEIIASVTGRIGRRNKRFTTRTPVYVRQFGNRRPVISLVPGRRQRYFRAANIYWRSHGDGSYGHSNLEEILKFIRKAPDSYGYGVWGEVNIVSHGNSAEWIINPFSRGRASNHLKVSDIRTHRADRRLQPAPAAAQLDGQSNVILRGCVLGENQPLLDEIRTLFGGRATIFAPKYLQVYAASSRAGSSETFWEQFFVFIRGKSVPNDRRLARLISAEYGGSPTAAEIRPLLANRDRRKVKLKYQGPFTFTWTGLQAKPSRQDAIDVLEPLFSNVPSEQRFGTTWGDWGWRIRITGRRGKFRARADGYRIRAEARRPYLDDEGNPVVPDITDPSHYGRSPAW